MGIFSRILEKLRGGAGGGASQQAGTQASAPGAQQTQKGTAGQQTAGAGQQLQNVDIDAVLAGMAKQKGGGGNYRESIVDLLKLLDLDSSLDARKELAAELKVNAGAHGSAEQNIALHKAVMREVAKNGGKVPDSMKD